MMYRTAAVGIFTNIGAFGGFCHRKPVSLERVQSGDFGMEKARKRRNTGSFCGGSLFISEICEEWFAFRNREYREVAERWGMENHLVEPPPLSETDHNS